MRVGKKKSLKSLQAGRPPTASPAGSMTRKASRTLINRIHQLEKRKLQAAEKGDQDSEVAAAADIAALGGLHLYQQASLQGQSPGRGGDTSKVLLEWLPVCDMKTSNWCPRMLEVGALTCHNACTTSGLFDMVHIDLNSQDPAIKKQDFMKRPLPERHVDKFDIISLSLVLNFVPSAAARGLMLARTLSFLRTAAPDLPGAATMPFPSLFLVLPRSCVGNSRYLTQEKLALIMDVLGYDMIKSKMSQKLAYSLWKKNLKAGPTKVRLAKVEVNPGRNRNNFAISLDL
ncbi:hypothetical protein CDD82_3288 [Ophiocordyceps australis]|uniref:25S rRNA adenine-N(1) methyltransferase n=1 Tax=Ophiocordyceps australis TaxID=1399860 RepID=A0A2C5ZAB2_9HYPO|nr:hypothetical protein CDD82_3288 [Ophiocordyceps australis]